MTRRDRNEVARPPDGVSDAAAWLAGDAAGADSRAKIAYLLTQDDVVAQIEQRFGRIDPAQQQGHVFEWMHELSFNLKAIQENDDLRLRVTTWLGEPHAPDDLRVVGAGGLPLHEVQAKVIGETAARVRAAADEKYDGMDLLVPSDHLAPASRLIEERLRMPVGPLHDRYADLHDRLADRVSFGGVSSDPVSKADLAVAAHDPEAFLHGLLSESRVEQLVDAGGAAAVVGTAISALTAIVHARAMDGSFGSVPWTQVGVEAAKAGISKGAVVAVGTAIAQAAQASIASGGSEGLGALAEGTLPIAMAKGAFQVGAAARGWATGDLDAAEAVFVASEGVARSTATWACVAAGQMLIPIPVVGGLVGAAVGSYGVGAVQQGLIFAVAARQTAQEWDAAYRALLDEADAAELIARTEQASLERALSAYRSEFEAQILPLFSQLNSTFWVGDPDEVLRDLARVTRAYGRDGFESMDDFSAFMRMPDATLTLKLSRD